MSTNATVEVKRSPLPAWLRAMRPKQWVKNILVFAAPVAAGALFDPRVLVNSLWAFLAFSLISASIYLINDVRDVEADRLHPKKRFRPIAAGELGSTPATVLAAVTMAASFAIGFWVAPMLGVTLAVYWVLQVGYSMFLKHQPIIDLAMVSSGFLLRAVAGGVASGIELSQWFLLVASFGSLYMVAGKRYSEMKELGSEAGTRAALERYSLSYLRFVWAISCSIVIMSYSLWTFEQGESQLWGVPWTTISIVPFVLALLRYAMDIDAGNAGEPEDVVLNDRVLQALAVLWLIPLGVGIFLG
ncbi:decaprenyl-phosphate phosphoribosyltransferase [Micropruina sonneratiae]|uniref:decaprenyl-phosphate phosphoribosyltransferase n=1 Tax=Micropruina sonneratiae TaxID=2986940 RepID=UPI0022278C0D|nr:decaprenyl-phosphate phosphoribosyltransferase [Micropruina sp. KQZ13P-5]MCW3157054.1 decaprenyl-phosphate phosphoribosyltransferase [Micropruina sp. KQZ13P-5]